MKLLWMRSLLVLPMLAVMGFSDVKVDARNVQSLNSSLQSILQPLAQDEQQAFMELFFQRAYYENCLVHGNDYSHKQVRGPEACAEEISGWKTPEAGLYLSDRRMDDKVEYVRSNVFGSTKHGHSANTSVMNFIDKYGSYVDGLTAREIVIDGAAIFKRGQRLADARRSEKAVDAIPALEAHLAILQANYPKIAKASPARFIAGDQAQCQRAIAKTTFNLEVLKAARDGLPIPAKPRGLSHTKHACMRVDSKWKGQSWTYLSDLP